MESCPLELFLIFLNFLINFDIFDLITMNICTELIRLKNNYTMCFEVPTMNDGLESLSRKFSTFYDEKKPQE